MALGKRVCKELLNHLFGKTPDTTPAGVIYLSLHTADPGDNGQTSNEATGTGYARKVTAASDWVAATDADPAVTVNANAITFAQAGATWSSGVNMTHMGFWTHLSTATEAVFIGRIALGTAKPVTSGDTPEFAAGSLTLSLT